MSARWCARPWVFVIKKKTHDLGFYKAYSILKDKYIKE